MTEPFDLDDLAETLENVRPTRDKFRDTFGALAWRGDRDKPVVDIELPDVIEVKDD